MGTTQQHPPSDLGPQPDGSCLGVGASVPAASAVSTTPEMRSDMSGAASGVSPGATPAGRRTRRLSLGSASGIVPLARDFTRQALYDWGWLPAATADRRAAAEDVLLVVSELVTNACLHAEGPEELRVSLDAKVLRLEVEDRGAGQPAPRTPHRAGRPGGHGMFIVQRLCLDWGVVRSTGMPGKTVWAELAAPA
ncbi:ATPase [Streptomyces sp. CB03234]|uniref:ATP-binding protein n=1 Tax=Streptomyces sp. (strain CB03234) TaxID=1703937 RepID=UPI0009401EE8|nr:ATP-binding protein [Streptomyces sp. CB03234]OKJ99790.1 ATPase [Streptomyces sp. CB03234]